MGDGGQSLLKLPAVLRLPALLLAIVLVCFNIFLYDAGDLFDGFLAWGCATCPENEIFGNVVAYGWIIILLFQIAGTVLGDKARFTNLCFSITGAILYISLAIVVFINEEAVT